MFRFSTTSTVRSALAVAAVALFASQGAMASQPKEISYWAQSQTDRGIGQLLASQAGDRKEGAAAQYASQAGDRKYGAGADYASQAGDRKYGAAEQYASQAGDRKEGAAA